MLGLPLGVSLENALKKCLHACRSASHTIMGFSFQIEQPMELFLRLLPLLFLLTNWPAYAGGSGGAPVGLVTYIIGIPVLSIVCIVQLTLLSRKSSQTIKILSAIVFFASLTFGLYVAADATALMRYPRADNLAIAGIYFGLLATSCWLYYRIVRKRLMVPKP